MNTVTQGSTRQTAVWDSYAQSFARITTHYQSEVYRTVAAMARGAVVDFGCGSAKLAPYLAANGAVSRYVGVDACTDMVHLGIQVLDMLNLDCFSINLCSIEDFPERGFQFGVSINSYYSWQEPVAVLRNIHRCLSRDADFVIATPNARLDMAKLMRTSAQDFLLNPDFQRFRQINDQLAGNTEHQFVSMDVLIGQLRAAGFAVQSCRSDFFEGGLNFVHTKAGSLDAAEASQARFPPE